MKEAEEEEEVERGQQEEEMGDETKEEGKNQLMTDNGAPNV